MSFGQCKAGRVILCHYSVSACVIISVSVKYNCLCVCVCMVVFVSLSIIFMGHFYYNTCCVAIGCKPNIEFNCFEIFNNLFVLVAEYRIGFHYNCLFVCYIKWSVSV